MLTDCTTHGHNTWLGTYGHVTRLHNSWSRYLTAQLPHISSKKFPSYFRLQFWIRTDKLHETKVPPQKLTVPQLLKKFPEFYRIRRFNSKFVTGRHWSLSWARLIRSPTSHKVSLRSIVTLRKGISGGHLYRQQRAFGFHKIRRISWLAEKRLFFFLTEAIPLCNNNSIIYYIPSVHNTNIVI